MPIQFSGTLDPGEYQLWTTWGWRPDVPVHWQVMPKPGRQMSEFALRALAVEPGPDGSISYALTVWNVGKKRASFNAYYTELLDCRPPPPPPPPPPPKVVKSTLRNPVVRVQPGIPLDTHLVSPFGKTKKKKKGK